MFKGNRHTGNLVTGTMPLTRTIADAFGVDESTIYRALEAGEKLTPEEAARLDAAPGRITMKDLRDLSKIGDADARRGVIAGLSEGTAKNAAAALKALKPASEGAVKDPVEDQLKALRTAWARAGAAARNRFVDEHGVEMMRILGLQLDVVMPRGVAAE